MNKGTEKELIKRAKAGDKDAFDTLVSDHYMIIYRIAFKFCGRKELAEDITQEVCIKLARTLIQFKGDSALSTWLYRMTINMAKDMLASEKRKNDSIEEYDESSNLADSSKSPEEVSQTKQVYAAVAKLSDGLKEAVVLVCMEGMSHKEAATVLNCKEGTISWRISEAKKQLALNLGGV